MNACRSAHARTGARERVDDAEVKKLVDEIFRVCGPTAVRDVRVACEKMKKVKR